MSTAPSSIRVPGGAPQIGSISLLPVVQRDQQIELTLAREPARSEVSNEVIARLPTWAAAFVLSISVSGLDDKEIYLSLGIDAATWSRIRKGEANLPEEKRGDFYDIVGNEIPLIWSALRRGYQLVMIQTEAERRADAERARADKLAMQVELMKDLLRRGGSV